mmetsp:Transcript_62215/g.116425  ORF Transcript_62215/g.116425 Transcript_62215/m.116425 type:complete len:296 (+) Transcript_62215:113-1000(+)
MRRTIAAVCLVTVKALTCSDDLDGPFWGIWIDGKNASEGPQAYGAEYGETMRRALEAVYKMEKKRGKQEEVDRQIFRALPRLLGGMPVYKYGGLFEMQTLGGRAFRAVYDCVRPELPQKDLMAMFDTDIEDFYNASCIPSGRPCRSHRLTVPETVEKLAESYDKLQSKASTSDDQLRGIASLMKNLALLHALPDRNGRSRLLLLQLELRRLGLACGTLTYNNNQNVYFDSIDTLVAKIKEGIDMYNKAKAGGSNPWLEQGNVDRHRHAFMSRHDSLLDKCTRQFAARTGRGLSHE